MIRRPRTEKNFTPENAGALTVAGCLNRIFKKVELDGLSDEAAAELADDIRAVADKFAISPKAAVLLAAIIEKSSNGCCEDELANYIGCTNIEFLGFHAALREMEDNGMIAVGNGHRNNISISQEALKAIEKDTEYKPLMIAGLTSDELFSRMRMFFGLYRKDVFDDDRLQMELGRVIERNPQLLFCRKVSDSPLFEKCNEVEHKMFLYLCHRYVSHGNQSVPIDILMNFTGFMFDEQRFRRQISNGRTSLQKEGLVTFGIENGYADETTLSLSDEVKSTFFDEIELAKEETVNHKDLISCDSIKEQQLFYNPTEEEQIERLANLLEEGNFRQVQERLEAEGMPKGFCAVFHGCPGSGKTASLKALAKKTGRDLFWVDLSSIKSKWVGESEQNVKRLFDTYRNMVRTREKAPILAVNEADAIFTKRITNVEHSVDNMYNAITDIVLNEMEKLDGIMIATTNLAGNMMDEKDNAMERRFLFKIQFNTPEAGVRAKIWKSKIKDLSDEDAATLGEKYVFSGGNIENIARKSAVEYVLSGKRPGLETLIKYCEEESITRKKSSRSKKIGFAA